MSEQRFGAMADAAAKKYGIPPAMFRSLISAESSWNPNAGSSAGARGLTQVVPKWHPNADLSSPRGQLDYGAKHLGSLYKKYGNWKDALSVYNSGRPWSRGQNIAETSAYVPKVINGAKQAGWSVGQRGNQGYGNAQGGPVRGVAAGERAQDQFNRSIPTGGGFDANAFAQLLKKTTTEALKGKMPGPEFTKKMTQFAGAVSSNIPVNSANPGAFGTAGENATPRAGTGRQYANVVPGGKWEPGSYAYGDPEGQGGKHMAIDIFGNRFVAPEAGTITRIDPSKGNSGQVYGGVVHLNVGGRHIVMRHVDPKKGLKVGQKVKAGTPLGVTSNWSGGPRHVHFEMYKGAYDYHNGKHMNPYTFYKNVGIL